MRCLVKSLQLKFVLVFITFGVPRLRVVNQQGKELFMSRSGSGIFNPYFKACSRWLKINFVVVNFYWGEEHLVFVHGRTPCKGVKRPESNSFYTIPSKLTPVSTLEWSPTKIRSLVFCTQFVGAKNKNLSSFVTKNIRSNLRDELCCSWISWTRRF